MRFASAPSKLEVCNLSFLFLAYLNSLLLPRTSLYRSRRKVSSSTLQLPCVEWDVICLIEFISYIRSIGSQESHVAHLRMILHRMVTHFLDSLVFRPYLSLVLDIRAVVRRHRYCIVDDLWLLRMTRTNTSCLSISLCGLKETLSDKHELMTLAEWP